MEARFKTNSGTIHLESLTANDYRLLLLNEYPQVFHAILNNRLDPLFLHIPTGNHHVSRSNEFLLFGLLRQTLMS